MKITIAHIMGKMNGGGVESVIMNYYKQIDRDKFQFDFICDNDSKYIPYDEINKLGGRVILVSPYEKLFKYLKDLKKVFKENNYKIVHSHINTLSIFPLYIAKICGIKIRIAHSHNTSSNKEFKRNIIKNIFKLFSKTYANYYFACSKLAGNYLFSNNYYVLNNAILLDKFKYNEKIRNDYRSNLNINSNTLVIGHIGRFMEQKNHEFLIDIFSCIHIKNKNSILLLIGDGILINNIKEKIKRLNLIDSVKFLGQRNDVNNLYQAMDVFLLPSLYEGLPVVGIEALSSGLPCFISDNITKEIDVLDNIEFISLNKSSLEWASIILEKIKNYQRISKINILTNKGFNIKKEVRKLENKYQELYKQEVI